MSTTTRSTRRRPTREEARATFARNAEHYRDIERQLNDTTIPWHRKPFITIDPGFLAQYAEDCLRWIDCAPAGALHLVAPLCGLDGTPMGDRRVGLAVEACENMRAARQRRGMHPFGPVAARALEEVA